MRDEQEPGYIIVKADGRLQLRIERPQDAGPSDAVPGHLLMTAWLYLYLVEHAQEICDSMPDASELVDRLNAAATRVIGGIH